MAETKKKERKWVTVDPVKENYPKIGRLCTVAKVIYGDVVYFGLATRINEDVMKWELSGNLFMCKNIKAYSYK